MITVFAFSNDEIDPIPSEAFQDETGLEANLKCLYSLAIGINQWLVVAPTKVYLGVRSSYNIYWYVVDRITWQYACVNNLGESGDSTTVLKIVQDNVFPENVVIGAINQCPWVKHSRYDNITEKMYLASEEEAVVSTPKPFTLKKPPYAWTIKAGKYERTA